MQRVTLVLGVQEAESTGQTIELKNVNASCGSRSFSLPDENFTVVEKEIRRGGVKIGDITRNGFRYRRTLPGYESWMFEISIQRMQVDKTIELQVNEVSSAQKSFVFEAQLRAR